jgi:hypothetical protein
MEKPRVRGWIEALPVMHNGREMFYLRDAEGIVEESLVVSRDVVFLISLMNGSRTVRDLQEEYTRAVGALIHAEQIAQIVEAMDNHFFLQNERFEAHIMSLQQEYEAAPCRSPFLSGKSYPEKPEELAAFLDDLFAGAETPEIARDIKGILAPHIDYQRGAKVYADVYRYLPLVQQELIVIFGTCHHVAPGLWNISLKDFATPFGTLPVPRELTRCIREHPVLHRRIAEWPHRQEHSIELQLPILHYLLAGRSIEILPILTGSMHEYVAGTKELKGDEPGELAEGLREVLAAYGRPYLVIAGADLAHIGAQFGDTYSLDQATLDRSRRKDELMLEPVKRVDAEGFFSAVKDEQDSRRICGLAPIYFQLSLLNGFSATLAGYDQWTDGASSVSFAGAIFHD